MKNLFNLLCVFAWIVATVAGLILCFTAGQYPLALFIAGLAAEAFPYAWARYKELKGKE